MSEFVFNNYEEFGLFIKINSDDIKSVTEDEPKKQRIDNYVKHFNASKGGCNCNVQKRKANARNQYIEAIPFIFTGNLPAVFYLKDMLGAVSVKFKKDPSDKEPFFEI